MRIQKTEELFEVDGKTLVSVIGRHVDCLLYPLGLGRRRISETDKLVLLYRGYHGDSKPESLDSLFSFKDGRSLRFCGVSHSQQFEGQWPCALKDLVRKARGFAVATNLSTQNFAG
jgi:hypothetical protein